MFHDDLNFDDEWPIGADCEDCNYPDKRVCFRHANEAERTANACETWDELKRQRHAREAGMGNDLRTERLSKLLRIANSLTQIDGEINSLILTAENDAGALNLLQIKIRHAEEYADLIRRDYEAAMDAA